MDKPAFFFVAHVLTKYNSANIQFDNFKKLTPTATKHYMVRHSTKPSYVTFVAIFDEPADYHGIKNKLSYYYGGTSKILKVHYSTSNKPTYFYSAHLIQDFTPLQKHNKEPARKQALVKTVLTLISPDPKVELNNYDSSILVELLDRDLRPEDIANINRALLNMPHRILLTSRERKKE